MADAQPCFEDFPKCKFKCIRGGACLAISLEGLEWLCKRKCSNEEIKKRNGKTYLQISGGHIASDESDLQPFYCLYDYGKSSYAWTNKVKMQSSTLDANTLKACSNQDPFASSLTSLNTKSIWTFLLNIPNHWFTDNLNQVTSPKDRRVIVNNKNIIARLFSDAFYYLDYWPNGDTEVCHNMNEKDVFDRDMVDVPNNNNNTEEISERSRRRKSVSFADDVIVYLFDQESPAVKLHSEPPNSTPSCLHSDVLFDDNGLEWEDDFLALEKNCNSQSRSRHCISSKQNWTVLKPERFFMSQSCLFLTHVTDSDLEL